LISSSGSAGKRQIRNGSVTTGCGGGGVLVNKKKNNIFESNKTDFSRYRIDDLRMFRSNIHRCPS